ncbi:MAG: short-subunit dehydrogenase [Bradymonadia bacterium]|jgi:short-subunit dehydrogenase
MRPPIENAIAVVTGASSGIGEALARQLAPRVSTLILVARRKARLDALAAELTANRPELTVRVEPCDLSQATQIDDLLGRLGRVDILVNNAGLGVIALFERSEFAKLDTMMRVNMLGLVQLTRGVLDGMLERKAGGILNISSSAGIAWVPGIAAYAGTKHFVTAFSEALGLELVGTGVTVTQVCPGPVATEFESVAGNPTGMEAPTLLELTAEQCARSALKGFAEGRALVIPGGWMKVLMGVARISPRWMHRLAMRRFGRFLRKKPA